ncbi:MAG: iron-only hydrogenase system regulator [Clostridiales bacterium]|nr:iron-only hydrogenase system regulator [Clostridiales bacterium]NLC44228.1 iron-only hydrogenase system regulator [Clostridiales bacterium]
METRLALIGIILENKESTPQLNAVLHEYAEYIVGRMGVPNVKEGMSVISIVVDAPEKVTSALSGKIGMLPYVGVTTMYSKKS